MRTQTTLSTVLLAILLGTASLTAQGGPGGGPPPVPPVPPVPVPPQNPITEAKRVLGKILFWEEQLSSDNTVACGTCHLTETGGGDNRPGTHPGPDGLFNTDDDIEGSVGVLDSDQNNDYESNASFGLEAQITDRAAPNFFGALWSPTQFWDGRADGEFRDPDTDAVMIPVGGSLENQVVGPPVSDVEMAHADRDWDAITAKLADATPMRLATDVPPDMAAAIATNSTYPDLFQAAFGTPDISATRIAFAIATYERTLVANQTPWDAFNAGNPAALTPQQQQGLQVFAGSPCSTCHVPPLFTDNQFHNIGLRPNPEDWGRRNVTNVFADRGRFKTPSLRNVGLRDKLMHVGWITDVPDAIAFYANAGGHTQFPGNRDPRLPVLLPPPAIPAVVDFLVNGLTDPRVANATFPFDRPTLLSERTADQPVVFGDELAGTGGFVPQMIADTQLVIQNPDFRAGIHGGLGGAQAFFMLSLGQAAPGTNFIGIPINVDLAQYIAGVPVTLSGSNPGEGVGTWHFAVGSDPSALGLSMFGQWVVADPATPLLSATKGAQWTFM